MKKPKKKAMDIKSMRVLGICAGQGALLFALRKNVIGNVEPRRVFHTPNEEQWKLNFGDIPFYKNKEAIKSFENVDIICSTPDCGASSIMRMSLMKQLGSPRDNSSINLVIEGIKYHQPKIFILENLPRLLSFISQDQFQKFFPDYKLVFHQRSVLDYGNSQESRKRLVIIGINKNTSRGYFNAFNKVFKVNTPKLTRELITLPHDYFGFIPKHKQLAMYDYRLLPKKNNLTVQQIHDLWVGDFKKEKKWPIKTAKMSTLPGVYRLLPDRYPLTVRPADRQFRPDGWPLSIEDIRIIMGFPERFKIYGIDSLLPEKEYLYWVNKARYTLAKGACYEIGKWFKQCLKQA